MTHLVAFPTRAGQSVVVEVTDEPSAGTVRAVRPGDVTETAARSFEAALGPVQAAAEAFVATLRNLTERPDEIGVEFAVKLSAKAGAIIAATDAEANFQVTLKWTRPADPARSGS